MNKPKRRFIKDPDALGEGLDTEQLLTQLGQSAELIARKGSEIRTACFLQCGKEHATGNRAIAINDEHASKLWQCHEYDCKKSGNLLSLVSLAIGGPAKPKGDDFWRAVEAIEAIKGGHSPTVSGSSATPGSSAVVRVQPKKPKVNIPLADSDNERTRSVANLHKKLTLDISRLNPAASRYVRGYRFLNEEVGDDWLVGYLSKNTGGDRSGGTLRGRFCIAVKNRDGKIVAYGGRDPEWEHKHAAWVSAGRKEKEPAKWLFPRSFHRGVELYGEHRIVEAVDVCREKLQGIGLPVVEGALDAINLWETLDTPCVAILSNKATQHQVERIAELAKQVSDGVVTMLYDCDEAGNSGADRDTVLLSKHCRVQRGWSNEMHGGAFVGKEPSHLTVTDWNTIKAHITGNSRADRRHETGGGDVSRTTSREEE